LYSGARHMMIDWQTGLATPSTGRQSQTSQTSSNITFAPAIAKPSKLQALILNLSDTQAHYVKSRGPFRHQLLLIKHLPQLLPIVVTPSLKSLNIVIHFNHPDSVVRDGLSSVVDGLRGMKFAGLTKLGITAYFYTGSHQAISQSWVSL
jgi:hypothetical protein